jgi:flagellar operon protein
MNTIDNNDDIRQRIDSYRYSGGSSPVAGNPGTLSGSSEKAQSFADVLKSKVDGIRFSAHASTRIKSRNIPMTPEIMGKLEKAVSGAAEKGARDSLIVMRNCAFIVNIPNRTVVTAMDGNSMTNNIFTNIDSAVLAE